MRQMVTPARCIVLLRLALLLSGLAYDSTHRVSASGRPFSTEKYGVFHSSGMRSISQVMGCRLNPLAVLTPGLRTTGVATVNDPAFGTGDDTQQILYSMVSDQSATQVFRGYKKVYGRFGTGRGNLGGPGRSNYLFYPRDPALKRATATFSAGDTMSPGNAGFVGSQPIRARRFVQCGVFIPLAYCEAYQKQHATGVEIPIPVELNK